ncbi:MAG: hypothetical protein K6C30_03655 [Bacteroidaceae bacterium]|nr:hypothetical protein [Bacteroidaceae bacterium]
MRRLQEIYPDRKDYKLVVYADSRGDEELLAIADEGFRVSKMALIIKRIKA